MARGHQRPVGPFFNQKRLQNSFQRNSANLLSTVVQTRVGSRGVNPSSETGSGASYTGRSLLLLKNLSGTEKEWEISFNHRSFNPQFLYCSQDFHDGNQSESQECHSPRRLGLFIGSKGCIFARPDGQTFSEVSSFHSSRKSLPILSSSIRSNIQPVRVHLSDANYSNISSLSFHHPVSVPGRLSCQKPELSSSSTGQTLCSQSYSFSQSSHQLGEIRPSTFSEFHIHRNGISYRSELGQSTFGQNSGTDPVDHIVQSKESSVSQTLSFTAGQAKCSCRLCRTRPSSYETSPVHSSFPVENTHYVTRTEDLSPIVVEQHATSSSRCTIENECSQASSVLRCEQHRLGSPPRTRGTAVSWCLVSRPISSTHQCIGDESDNFCSAQGSTSYSQLSHDGFHQQIDSCVISQETGRNTLPGFVCGVVEHSPVVSTKQYCLTSQTHTRQIQYSGGPAFSFDQANPNRMDTQTVRSQQNLSIDEFSQYRPVCDTSLPSSSDVRVSHFGRRGSSNRRPDNELERHTRICVPSISHYSECSGQDQTISVQNSSNSSILAIPTFVSGASRPTCVSSHSSSHNSKPARTVEREVPSSKP